MITQIGPHRVQHAPIIDGLAKLMDGGLASLVYSDPPWNSGNLKYWQTINKRHTGVEPETVDLDDFLTDFFQEIVTYTTDDAMIIIEFGQSLREELITLARSFGLISHGVAQAIYGSRKNPLPLDVHFFSRRPGKLSIPAKAAIYGTMGFLTLRKAAAPLARPGEIILDPCCGMGYTARLALETGMIFRGNELNRKRLQKTIDRLGRHENLS